jgi:hypothetical protein
MAKPAHLAMLLSLLLGAACGDPKNTAADAAAGSGGNNSGGSGAGEGVGGAGRLDTTAPPRTPQKVDLLFMVDNSISMADKQEVLAQAVPDLLARLAYPNCIGAAGEVRPSIDGECPSGFQLQFAPVADLHVGFISSSLGDGGANVACALESGPRYVPDRIDMAHLVGSLERGQNTGANTSGFLEWRSGEGDINQLATAAQQMLQVTGDNGCGWEMSLESWYRFLVDPMPYKSLVRVPCTTATPDALNCVAREMAGDQPALDDVLLAQRAAFLRPDSLVLIVMLTDENDCSLQIGNMSWTVLGVDSTQTMFKGSSTCDQDPNAKCCYACGQFVPEGCPADPSCTADVAGNRLEQAQDGRNLRCMDQRRRFGVDFLYPTARYVNALTQTELCWNANDLSTAGCATEDLRDNPLFADGRRPSQVVLAGVLGVPWQALTADPNPAELRFKTSAEMKAPGDTTWAQILGDLGTSWRAASGERPERPGTPRTLPLLPQMLESSAPRAGIEAGNPLNGREFDTSQGTVSAMIPDDLQYACIYPLPEPIDCAQRDPNVDNCGCFSGVFDKPLCEQTPGVSVAGTTQYWAHAYPGPRLLQVLKDYGDNSVVTSICARNTGDASRPDYGYRPALAAVLARIEALGKR